MEVTVIHARSGKEILKLSELEGSMTILELKTVFHRHKRHLYPSRQSFRLEPRGSMLKDEQTLESCNIRDGCQLYFKDLGMQIGWSTVFLAEYSSPMLVYLLFYMRPSFIYGASAASLSRPTVVHIAVACWVGHYAKRVLETLFVHRFSHGTMPIANLFKNCSYYWGFSALVAYFINHPLYTPPMFGDIQIYFGLAAFLVGEYGNFVSHCVLRDLRPPGTKVRKIPRANNNPFSFLFSLVSCPNYTYEMLSWVGFSIMTQALTSVFFTIVGGVQMAIWAGNKHRAYRREFKDYPRFRRAMIPFLF